ncbi:hypothetical protein [Acidovorax sp. Leaf78]|uniref:hypothetical protein n=1 Tax=unclassified Acidovorax TaxID=2684926 RepID=UPI0012E279AB|nr:hypothetical protein [Acidovorax sp. Leaf78]
MTHLQPLQRLVSNGGRLFHAATGDFLAEGRDCNRSYRRRGHRGLHQEADQSANDITVILCKAIMWRVSTAEAVQRL